MLMMNRMMVIFFVLGSWFAGEVLGITRFGIAKMKDSVLMLASLKKPQIICLMQLSMGVLMRLRVSVNASSWGFPCP